MIKILKISLIPIVLALALIVNPSMTSAYEEVVSGAVWDINKIKAAYGNRLRGLDRQLRRKIGPGTILGNSFIPDVTSFRVYNSQGDDITYEGCALPEEQIEFVISSEHRTCGTRSLAIHYNIDFADQTAHRARRAGAPIGRETDESDEKYTGRSIYNFSGDFNFIAPLESGAYLADVTTLNPVSFASGEILNVDPTATGYYTYEIGVQRVDVCNDDDSYRVSCRPNPVSIEPGNRVTFEAEAVGGEEPYSFEWGDGSVSESITETYNTEGSYSQNIKVTDNTGAVREAMCAVSVQTGNLDMDGLDFRVLDDGTVAIMDGDGNVVQILDGSNLIIDLGRIKSFGIDLDQGRCVYVWETEFMDSCKIVNTNTGVGIDVPVNGSKKMSTGVYQLECRNRFSNEPKVSEAIRCIESLDMREV